MRVLLSLAVVAAAMSTMADASDVRLSALPDSLHGTWGTSRQACGGSDGSKIVISGNTYSRADAKCEIFWVTVTAAPKGANYSARARCVEQSTGKAYPPSNLMFRPGDSDHISVGTVMGSLTLYQRCP